MSIRPSPALNRSTRRRSLSSVPSGARGMCAPGGKTQLGASSKAVTARPTGGRMHTVMAEMRKQRAWRLAVKESNANAGDDSNWHRVRAHLRPTVRVNEIMARTFVTNVSKPGRGGFRAAGPRLRTQARRAARGDRGRRVLPGQRPRRTRPARSRPWSAASLSQPSGSGSALGLRGRERRWSTVNVPDRTSGYSRTISRGCPRLVVRSGARGSSRRPWRRGSGCLPRSSP